MEKTRISGATAIASSKGVVKNGLNLFAVPPTDMSLMSRREISYALFAPGITPIKFQIPPQIGMVDMSQSYVKVKLKLKHADGTALEAPSHMYPVNNFGHSIFKDVKVTLNGTLISGQSSLYPYKAYFDQSRYRRWEDAFESRRVVEWVEPSRGRIDS